MKKSLLTLACLINAACGFSQTLYPSGVTNCIARYDFSSTGQTIASLPDVSGNNNSASTVQNLTSAPGWRNKPNRAMLFNGTSSYAQISNNALLTPNAVTMVALVKANGYYNGLCQVSMILCKGAPGYISGQYGMGFTDDQYDNNCNSFDSTHQQLIGYFYNSMYTSGARPAAGNYVSTSKWYFVAISYDGTQLNYYQAIMDSTNHINNLAPSFSNSNVAGSFGANSQDLTIGKHLNPPYPYWFNGKMDEVALFNRVLSNTEIQSVYDYLWEVFAVNPSFANTTFCVGSSFSLPVTVKSTNTLGASNIMMAQLSDATGSFTNPALIGSANLTASGNIPCTIPASLPAGTGYKIRLVSSVPYQISEVYDANISLITTAPAPTVSITAAPGSILLPGQSVTFTAMAGNAGNTPSYQWLKNGSNVPGATFATYTTNSLSDNDVVSVTVKSTYTCAQPDSVRSSGITITIKPNAINTVSQQGSGLSIYPNPTNGDITLQATFAASKEHCTYHIVNSLGQVILSGPLSFTSGNIREVIHLPAGLVPGVYQLSLDHNGKRETIRFNMIH